jgi:hypothetical protein
MVKFTGAFEEAKADECILLVETATDGTVTFRLEK